MRAIPRRLVCKRSPIGFGATVSFDLTADGGRRSSKTRDDQTDRLSRDYRSQYFFALSKTQR
jgi:hypothetical protein